MCASRPAPIVLLALVAAALGGCAQGEGKKKGGGGDGDGLSGTVIPPPAEPGSARLLYFTMGGDAWLASAAGTDPRPICEGAEPWPSATGARALCVPADEAQPLRLYDLGALGVIAEYAEWRRGALSGPMLSPDGSRVAVVATGPAGDDVVRVFDDGGNVVGEIAAFGVLAFASPDVLLLDRGGGAPALWRLGGDEAVALAGTRHQPVGPDPAGAVYEVTAPGSEVVFQGADGRKRELGAGRLGGVYGRRVLVVPSASALDEPARVVDLLDDTYEATFAVPRVPFDRQLGVRLVGPRTVLVEQHLTVWCNAMAHRGPTKTIWYDVDDGSSETVAETGADPHVVLPAVTGDRALVLDVDPCGEPLGTGRVVDLDGDERPLTDFLPEPVEAGAISPEGRFVAVSLENGVRVIDLSSGTVRVAATGAEGGATFHFREGPSP